MRLRELNVGCFGGGTGMPSVLGGLKNNPWLRVNAVVTMFDSGGSSGQLRDELGVLPPGDILKCALALSRNAREARRVLLARLPMLEHARLGGHTGGNLLLSMMQRYSGDFLDAVDGLSALLGCRGPRLAGDGRTGVAVRGVRGRLRDPRGSGSGCRTDLRPPRPPHLARAGRVDSSGGQRDRKKLDAVIIGPGSFYTSLMPIFLVRGVAEAMAGMRGPIIFIANLLTEGRGMAGFTAAEAVARIEEATGRRVDVVITNTVWPAADVLERYAQEHKQPLLAGDMPAHCEVVGGEFWTGDIARHDRLRLAYALWSILSRRLLTES